MTGSRHLDDDLALGVPLFQVGKGVGDQLEYERCLADPAAGPNEPRGVILKGPGGSRLSERFHGRLRAA